MTTSKRVDCFSTEASPSKSGDNDNVIVMLVLLRGLRGVETTGVRTMSNSRDYYRVAGDPGRRECSSIILSNATTIIIFVGVQMEVRGRQCGCSPSGSFAYCGELKSPSRPNTGPRLLQQSMARPAAAARHPAARQLPASGNTSLFCF